MSQLSHLSEPPVDVVHHLYLTSEALTHLALTLPETMGGLAHMISRLGRDVQLCAVLLDDEPPEDEPEHDDIE